MQMMDGRIIFTPGFILMFGLFIYAEIKELVFYRKNNWDWTVNNPNRESVYYEGDFNRPSTNRERVLFARPMFIFISGLFAIILTLSHF
jgi:hypothetical protein